jgi:hypothetical protein
MTTQTENRPPAEQVSDAATSGRQGALARALVAAAVGTLCLAALVAIGIFLFGEFGETEARLLGTAVTVTGYSLTGLAATTALGRRPTWLAPLGLGASVVGFVLMVALIWTTPDDGLLPRATMSALVLAVAIAHAALLLPRRADFPLPGAVLRATLAASAVLAAMLIVLILTAVEPGEFYFRLLGVAAVLVVLGTLLVPISRKVAGGKVGSGPGAQSEAGEGPGHDLEMAVTFKGRSFAARATRDGFTGRGFVAEAWEIASTGRDAIASLAQTTPLDDPYEALALAVLYIARTADVGEPTGLGQGTERTVVGASADMNPRQTAPSQGRVSANV